MASWLLWCRQANVQTRGLSRGQDEKPACFLNSAGLFRKPGCPLVWRRRRPFCWIAKSCSAVAVVCLPPRHPPCVHTGSSLWASGAHDKGGFGFSRPRPHPYSPSVVSWRLSPVVFSSPEPSCPVGSVNSGGPMASAPQPPRAASVSAQMPGLEKSVDNIVVKTKTNSLDSEGCWHRRLRNIYWTRR